MPIRASIVLLILVIALFLAFFWLRPGTDGYFIERTRFLMGTVVQVKIPAVSPDERIAARNCIDEAFREIERVEGVFSIFRDDSEVSKINRLATFGPVTTNDEVFSLIAKSVEYSRKTDGAFDITVGPLVGLWKRARSAGKIPAPAEIRETLSRVGAQNIVLDRANKTVFFKKAGMSLDLGGAAKGYATDKAIQILQKLGIKNAIVDSGGDMYCLGRRSKNKLWNVGIQHPRAVDGIFLELELQDRAIDTSGDYEKYFIVDQKRYSHIIDPKTGYPIGDGIISASVIAPDSATSDILATALCILGDRGIKIAESMSNIDAVIIRKDKGALKVEMTKELKARYNVTKEKSL